MCKAAIILLLCGLLAQSSSGRKFLQTSVTDCTWLHPDCTSCEAQNSNTGTVVSCLACTSPAYRVTTDSLSCECSPGYFPPTNDSKTCSICGRGSFCSGGIQGRQGCGELLTTLSAAASNSSACITLPGVAYMSGAGTTTQCPVNTYNVGGNQRNCTACPGKLVTSAPGAASIESCQAPPGYFYRNRQALPCAVGSYKPGINKNTVCQACPEGTTTRSTLANSSADCSVVLPGYEPIFDDAGTTVIGATPCPIGTYSTDGQQCTPCTAGLTTEATKRTAASTCVAPPGFGFYPERVPADFPAAAGQNASTVIACPIGWYKAGFALEPCTSCGVALLTDVVASISADACYIPAGYGSKHVYMPAAATTSVDVPALVSAMMNISSGLQEPQQLDAAKCGMGSYGAESKHYGLEPLPCQPCPEHTTTPDAFPNAGNTSDVAAMLMTSIHNCSNIAGYGWQHSIAAECPTGFFNPGYNLQPCTVCGVGLTTAQPGATGNTDCIAKPGWQLVDVANATSCPTGTWSAGGTQPQCTPCPAGSTTVGPASPSANECSICLPGWGAALQQANAVDAADTSALCEACDYGFYSPGGVSACVACQEGYTTPRQSAACVPVWSSVEPYTSIVANTSALVRVEAGTAPVCQQQCATITDCQFWIYRTEQQDASNNGCWLKSASTTASPNTFIAFKLITGDYTVWPADTEADSQIGDGTAWIPEGAQAAPFASQCLDACDASASCLGMWTHYSWNTNWECKLMRGQFRHRESSAIQAVPSRISNAIWAQEEPIVDAPAANTPVDNTTPPADPATNATPADTTPASNTADGSTPMATTGSVAVEPTADSAAMNNPATEVPDSSTPDDSSGSTAVEPTTDAAATETPATDVAASNGPAAVTPAAVDGTGSNSVEPNTTIPGTDEPANDIPVTGTTTTNAPASEPAVSNTQNVVLPGAGAPVIAMPPYNSLDTATPVANAPASGAAAINMPATDTPAANVPAAVEGTGSTAVEPPTNTPAATTPAANTPAANTPAANTPVNNTPATNAPATNTPADGTAATNAPAADTPEADTPATNTPAADIPATNTPAADTPATNTPAANTSLNDTAIDGTGSTAMEPATNTPAAATPTTNTPAANAPANETAATNTPAADIPATNTPEADTPATNTPAADIPATNTPAADTPATNTPAADISATNTPAAESPATSTPAADTPGTNAPATNTPVNDTAVTNAPTADIPATNTPAADIPATNTPAADTPATNTPAADIPATNTPAADTPAANTPAADTPGSNAPATNTPLNDTAATNAPTADIPATNTPAADITATNTPAANTPATNTPGTDTPAFDTPATNTPVNVTATTVEPGASAPVIAMPPYNSGALETPARNAPVAMNDTAPSVQPAINTPTTAAAVPDTMANNTVEPGAGPPVIAIPRYNTPAVQPAADNSASNAPAVNTPSNGTAAVAAPVGNNAAANSPATNGTSTNGTLTPLESNTAADGPALNSLPANTEVDNDTSGSLPLSIPVQEASIPATPDVVAVPVVPQNTSVQAANGLNGVPADLVSNKS